MILILERSQSNQLAAQKLSAYSSEAIFYYADKPDLSAYKDDTLSLLDISAHYSFSKVMPAAPFSKLLVEDLHLPAHIKHINLIGSDIDGEESLGLYARDLLSNLPKAYEHISIKCTDYPGFHIIFVKPPTEQKTYWQIYGINRFDISPPLTNKIAFNRSCITNIISGNDNFQRMDNCEKKKLLWEGDNLYMWFKQQNSIYTLHTPKVRYSSFCIIA